MEEERKDYSHLTDRIVEWRNGKLEFTGKVVLVDFDLGITIVDADDKDHYLTCLQGPIGYRTIHGHDSPRPIKSYVRVFNKMVKMIEEGHYEIQDLPDNAGVEDPFSRNPSSSSCVFAQ